MHTFKIGISSRLYPEQRNIIDILSDREYRLVRDFYSASRRLAELFKLDKLFTDYMHDAQFKFYDAEINQVDIIHLFNGISFGKTPWLSTFETLIPRYRAALSYREVESTQEQGATQAIINNQKIFRALDALAGGACKKIIAISRCTLGIQNIFLKHYPDYKDEILKKCIVIHPPQNLIHSDRNMKYDYNRNILRFIFVGHQFFSKGGREVLAVLKKFNDNSNEKLKLTIVSKLSSDKYATHASEDDVSRVKKFIVDNSDWIEYYDFLPHEKVLDLIKRSDVGLLPSYAETYGYTVLEYQAAGLPVITTDVRAFPEINNNNVGWIISVPKRNDGEAIFMEPGGRDIISKSIAEGLENILIEIIDKPELIYKKGINAQARIKTDHDFSNYALKLQSIYLDALNDSAR